MTADVPETSPGRSVRVVLVADPGLPSEIARALAPRLPDHLRRAVRARVGWQVDTMTAPLSVGEQADVSDIAEAVRNHLDGAEWDVAIFLTDLPRRARLYPISVEVDTALRAALISLPALGVRRLRRRVRQAVVDVVRELVAHEETPRHPEVIGRPPREPVPDTRPGPEQPRRYIVPGLRGHARLVAGMVYANRPWRLFGSLSRALAGVFATATVLFINSATWNLATALGAVQHAVITAVSAVALTLWIIVDHQLWERGTHLPAQHHPLYPYNLVTLVTIALAVVVLATALFATLVAVSFLLLDASVLRKFIGRQVDVGDYLFLAWFITAIAMIGGAFGTSLEGDEKVSDAAYGRRQRERQRMLRQMSRPARGGRREPDTTDG
ncbi:hypothetical protein ACF1A5_05830 [Streptomyces sp. NPDC014864]|uniref:hypothetical protein n=1 Tax=Streptomyces sp. NPDC014864 TaxID=3364924 RepID=UPI0036F5D9C2